MSLVVTLSVLGGLFLVALLALGVINRKFLEKWLQRAGEASW
jgi:preprotein translocase subunit SecG